MGSSTSAALFYRIEDVCNGFSARFGPEIAFTVEADADGISFMPRFPITNIVCTFICSARWILPLILSELSSISARTWWARNSFRMFD